MLKSKPSPFSVPVDARWFVVRTVPNGEQRAAGELRQLGLRVAVPKREFLPRAVRLTKPKPRKTPLLVGYVLVRFPARLIASHRTPQFSLVLSCRHVAQFDMPYITYVNREGDRVPMPLLGEEVKTLLDRQRANEFNDIKLAAEEAARRVADLRTTLKQGGRVVVMTGLYVGSMATLSKIHDNGSADILLHLVGKDTKLHVDEAATGLMPLVKSRKQP